MNLQRIIAKLILWKYKQQYKLNKWLRSVAFIKRALVWFTLFRADVQLKYAIMEADKKHSVNNRRYYVIPNLAHRLITHDRAQLRKLRTKGYFGHDARMPQFHDECFYCTPHANGKAPLTPAQIQAKRLQWLDYILQAKGLK